MMNAQRHGFQFEKRFRDAEKKMTHITQYYNMTALNRFVLT